MKLSSNTKVAFTLVRCLSGGAVLLSAVVAQAHLTYGGRDFGSFTGLGSSSVTISNQAVTGNFGWADAADGILGDSHKARAYRFHLDNLAWVDITAAAKADATATSIGGLLPGISIYQGLGAVAPFAASQTALPASADHDFGDASVAWRTAWAQSNLGPSFDATVTDGSWNALGSWKMGGDGDLTGDFSQLSSFTFKGFGLDFDLNGVATAKLQLPAGDYTIMIGGNDLANKVSADAAKAYGVSVTLLVSPVPEPQTWVLMAAGTGALNWAFRRSSFR